MIYIAGGTRTNWRDEINLSNFDIMSLQGKPLGEIMQQELDWLDECDAILAWFPKENPSGIGLATEMGYVKALGKPIVLVHDGNPKINWLQHIADFVTTDMNEAVAWINNIS
jgi:nucleoside 2-deoxyribosyltransferase